MSASLPRSIDEFTPRWLGEVLGAPVRAVSAAAPDQGTATRLRLAVEYVDPSWPGPTRLFVKTTIDNPNSDMFAAASLYENEARFYTEVLPILEVPAPRCFFADFDPADGHAVVVTEDLAARGCEFGSALAPLTPDAVDAVLGHMANYHAALWQSPRLDEFHWLSDPLEGVQRMSLEFFAHAGAHSLGQGGERHGSAPPSLTDPETVATAMWRLMEFNNRPPVTFVHGDPHLGNFAFYSECEPVFLDWQVVRRQSWAHDVSYHVVMGLTPEDRLENERDLLRGYLARLSAAGVNAPNFDDAFLAYRAQPIYGSLVWAATPPTMQAPEIVDAFLARQLAAVEQLDSVAAVDALP